jgi:uncharacterized protein YjiS (DUF1127 family)
MEIQIMSALSLSAPTATSNLQDAVLTSQVDAALDARRLRSQAFAAFIAGAIVALANSVAMSIARVKSWNERRATFAELEALDDRILADIGLSRGDISQVAQGHYVRDAFDYSQHAAQTVKHVANQDRNRNAA